MFTVFVLCHEGEIPYVLASVCEVVDTSPSPVHIVDHGSTEKMYMGYVLLRGEGEPPGVLLTELRANPDVYLYAVQRSGTTVEGSAQVEETSTQPEWWQQPLTMES